MSASRRRFLTNSALVGGAALFGGVGLDALGSRASAATASTLSVALKNNTSSTTVYAFVTGTAISNNALVLLESDGRTLYYPASPSSTLSPLAVDCAIPLGGPGSTTTITIPLIAGGRVWFSFDKPITFLLNPGPALVEPSVSNTSDPNINLMWDFCEFTYNSSQLYADISYVDFVSIPIGISLTDTSGNVQNVAGMPANGLAAVCSGLIAQNNADGAGWNKLIVTSGGTNLRALSPNNGIVLDSSLFSGYFQPYINQVWSKYESASLTIDTQASWGSVTGQVSGSVLNFPGATDSSGTKGSTSFTWTVKAGGSGGGCTGVAAWSATASYVPGNQVTYAGDLWTSTWYSTGAVPDAATSWDVWKNDGAC